MVAPPRRSPLSLLLLRRRFFSFLPLLKPTTPTPSHSFFFFSSSSPVPAQTPELPLTKPPPLSARLSFVIDQLDSLDRSRSLSQSSQLSARDAALRGIQSWRHSRDQDQQPQHPPPPNQTNAHETDKAEEINHHGQDRHAVVFEEKEGSKISMGEVVGKMEVELVHPWPEWIELMERLAQQKYFDLARVDEDRVAAEVPTDLSEVQEEEEEVVAMDFSRDWITVRSACTNFGRDRFDIIKYVGLIIFSSIL